MLADKTEEKPNMSARRSVSADKTGEMINMSVGHKVMLADKTEVKPNMSAGYKVCRRTKHRKS